MELEVPKKKKLTKRRKKELIFIIVLLAYPVAQFLLTWIFINSYSVYLSFCTVDKKVLTFEGFGNYIQIIEDFFNPYSNPVTLDNLGEGVVISSSMLALFNSLGYGIITIFISLPLALIASYFLSKKMPLANVFRFIFFLPNIISIVALIYAFKLQLDPTAGMLYNILQAMGITIGDSLWPNNSLVIYAYCIWAGIGYNVLLFSGAIGRVPKELYESAQMDGAGDFKQFTKIMIPMIWPTVVTMLVLGMTSILTLYLQPVLFGYDTAYTIAGQIFDGASYLKQQPLLSAYGLLFSFIFAPIILLIRKLLSKKYSDVDC